MDVRLADKRCLTPRLLGATGRDARRVEGVLRIARPDTGEPNARHFVDAVDYDGRVCRYRVGGETPEEVVRVDEEGPGDYRAFSRLVVERLCALGGTCETPTLHRFPGAPPSRALTRRARRAEGARSWSVTDTCITADGHLWARATLTAAMSGHDGEALAGWLLLADADAVLGEGRGDAGVVPTPLGAVA